MLTNEFREQRGNGLLWRVNCKVPDLNEGDIQGLMVARQPSRSEAAIRTSRGAFWVTYLPNGQKVLVRKYRRGGLMARIIEDSFFQCPVVGEATPRPFAEFEHALLLKSKGFACPDPLVAIVQQQPFCRYSGYIVYEYMESADNLLSLCATLPIEERNRVCYLVGQSAALMLKIGVLHADLHLGNVLVAQRQVYIIDYDKSTLVNAEIRPGYYQMKLIERWRRSVEKHGLSDELVESFIAGLNQER